MMQNLFYHPLPSHPDQMRINVNGKPIEVGDQAKLADVLGGQPYVPGTYLAIIRSLEQVVKETSEFEFVTEKGSFIVRVQEGAWKQKWLDLYQGLAGRSVRWRTSKIDAIGSFPSSIPSSRDPAKVVSYDCFFALGGYDNQTTYIMIARQDHEAAYGVAAPVFGRVTSGRHVVDALDEADKVLEVRPVIIELRSKDAMATKDLETILERDMSVETFVQVDLDPRSPVSVEHFLVAIDGGTLKVTEKTESFTANSSRMDVSLIEESHSIREPDLVTVRHQGDGMGRIYIYKTRRQVSNSHNIVGKVSTGHQLVHLVPEGGAVTVVPRPERVMVIGMTQAEGQRFLESRGLRQVRTGNIDDSAIIVEQEPELTMHVMEEGSVDTFGTTSDRIHDWYLFRSEAPASVRYLEKLTGLDHKPIGTVKVHFTFEGMPMVTFDGDDQLGASLYPEPSWKDTSRRADIGVTNMSRPNRGLIGIRLQDSPEFGPTGEEQHGTNLIGRFAGDLDRMMAGLKDGDIVYLRETEISPDKPSKPRRKPASDEVEAKPKKPAAKKSNSSSKAKKAVKK
jgi:putative methanogenesis marker protein 3